MATAIEAKSLSEITAIADEPPHGLDQRHGGHAPLTLYIARVPGSQDVFLTTMKPREKVVSAQDVESSLYYCHLDRDEDHAIRASLQDGDEMQNFMDAKRRSAQLPPDHTLSTRRKSLPKTPQPEGSRPEAPPKVYPHFQQPGFVQRKPVGRKPLPSPRPLPALPNAGEISPGRKPVGALPQNSSYHSQGPGKENVRPDFPPEMPPALPPRTGSDLSSYDARSSEQAPRLPPRRPSDLNGKQLAVPSSQSANRLSTYNVSQTSPTNQTSSGFSITMIRRDPSSGGQWNVGKIVKQERLAVSSSGIESAIASGVDIEIHTSGYDKFAAPPQVMEDDSIPGYQPFHRKLQTQRPKMAQNSSRRSMFRSSEEVPRRSSEQTDQHLLQPQDAAKTNSTPNLCFLSPWSGMCEFSTGASGRTLKCRHTTPSSSNEVDPMLRRLNSSAVSELRLNLPVVGSSGASRPPMSASHSRTSFFSHKGHRHSVSADSTNEYVDNEPDEWDDAEEERMDLSLGQERAGGGFGGKKAKLGKLIVEGEGLLMLDLIVAANMGFWWNLKHQGR